MNTFGRWDKILLPPNPHVHPCAFMPNDPKEDEISLEIWCDLLEKELKAARPRNSRDEILPSPTARKAMDEHQNPEEAVESGKDHLRAAAGNLKEAAGAKVEKICHAAEQKAAECSSAKHDSLKEDLR